MTELSFEVARGLAATMQGFGRRPRARASRWRLGAALATLTALVVAPHPAEASPDETPATIELRYFVAKGIARCFSEDEFRDAVRARLADHSFASRRPTIVTTSITREGSRLRATVTLREEGDASSEGEVTKETFAAPSECRTLSAAAALAVSLAIERARSEAPPPPEAPPEAPAETPPEAPPEPEPEHEPTREPRRAAQPLAPSRPTQPLRPQRAPFELRTHASLTGEYGILPGPSIGESVGASLRIDGWSAGLEVGAWLPASVSSSASRAGAKAWLSFMSGSACAERARLFVCGVGTLGGFRASGTGRLLSRSSGSLYVALGVRLGTEIPLVGPFSLAVHGSVLTPLLRPTLRIGDALLWRAPIAGGELGIGLRMSIL